MNWRQRKKVFLAALEIVDVSRGATAGGVSRKLQELAEFVEAGGKVKGGALFVTAARKGNHTWLDWAVDFLDCLPEDPKQKEKIFAAYVEEDYFGDQDGWPQRKFWSEVEGRGLGEAGLYIARQM